MKNQERGHDGRDGDGDRADGVGGYDGVERALHGGRHFVAGSAVWRLDEAELGHLFEHEPGPSPS
ncbi:MAG: hypothetical protein ACLS6O_00325 [Bifidobacterium sp.]